MAMYLVHRKLIEASTAREAMLADKRPNSARPVVRVERCVGEAHKNAHIDHCGLCLNTTWGWMASDVQASDADTSAVQSAVREALVDQCLSCCLDDPDDFAKVVKVATAAALSVLVKRAT